MPYKPEQQTAIFMDMMRRRGKAAARAFAREHFKSKPAPAQGAVPPYKGRKKRSK